MGTAISIIILMFAITIFIDNKKEEKNKLIIINFKALITITCFLFYISI